MNDPGKTARNDVRVAQLATHGLAIEDALSAYHFIQVKTGHKASFEEAVDFCLGVKVRYPGTAVSEVLEAGLIAMETGFHDDPEVGDAEEFARRIHAHVRFDP